MQKKMKKMMAVLMAALMVIGVMPMDWATVKVDAAETTYSTMVFNPSAMDKVTFASNSVTEKNGFFIHSKDGKVAVAASAKSISGTLDTTFKETVNVLKMGSTTNFITFSVSGPATLKIWEYSSSSSVVSDYTVTSDTGFSSTASDIGPSINMRTIELDRSGVYTIQGGTKQPNIYYIELTGAEGTTVGSTISRTNWDGVTAPTVGTLSADVSTKKISVPWTMKIGATTDACDLVRVKLYNAANELLETKIYTEGTGETSEFTVSDFGDYHAVVEAVRGGVTEVKTATSDPVTLSGPLEETTVTLTTAANGKIKAEWTKVAGADKYEVSYKEGTGSSTVAETVETEDGKDTYSVMISGLTIGKEYEINVKAIRGAGTEERDYSNKSATVTTVATVDHTWTAYTDLGSGAKGTIVADGEELATGTVDDKLASSLTLTATGGKIGDSETGMIFYGTQIDAKDENFVLSGKFKVTATQTGSNTANNQSGFGIMAIDTLNSGDTCRYYNSVGAMSAKYVEETYSEETGTTLTTYNNIPGARFVSGYTDPTAVSNTNQNILNGNSLLDNYNGFFSYNDGKVFEQNDEITFTLRKSNTGYHIILNGDTENEVIYYYPEELLKQDSDYVYVGFVASRYVVIDVTDISFKTISPSEDDAALPIPVKYTTPNIKINTGTTTGSTEYNFEYRSNLAGHLVVKDDEGKVRVEKDVEANEFVNKKFALGKESTEFTCTLTPSKEETLVSYADIVKSVTVKYKSFGEVGQTIYVAPNGSSSNDGTKESPLDIYTAVAYAQEGHRIVLLDGTYMLTKGVSVSRGHDGSENALIILMAENTGKAILDLSGIESGATGLAINANYWKVFGIDLINAPCSATATVTKAVHVTGSHNIVEMCNFYDNGCTGLQISGVSTEPYSMWPSYNLIKNCSSYNNADYKVADADGFGIKLTVGDGNKLYGCIAHHNIDDGYDLYAKSTTGSIGDVIIENCLAYSNGFLTEDAVLYNSLSNGTKQGEGNGFKLGGESVSGKHQLINCVSFNNGAKGITSNSGPDCIVKNCTVFNNSIFDQTKDGAENFSLYTNASTCGWTVSGTISFLTSDVIAKGMKKDMNEGYKKNKAAQTEALDAIFAEKTNYLYADGKCQNADDVEVASTWFTSTDVTKTPIRRADGTIDMQGLLVLTAAAPTDSGARLVTTGEAISVKPQITTVVSGVSTFPSYNLPVDTEIEEVESSRISADAIVEDENGNVIDLSKVALKVVEASEESIASMKEAFEKNEVVIADAINVKYYDMSLMAEGSVVKLKNGRVRVTFKYDSSVDLNEYEAVVYHLKDNGELEKLTVTAGKTTFTVDATSFSPFAVAYVKKAADTSEKSDTNTPTGDTTATVPFAIMAILGMAMIAGVYFFDKKRKALVRR